VNGMIIISENHKWNVGVTWRHFGGKATWPGSYSADELIEILRKHEERRDREEQRDL